VAESDADRDERHEELLEHIAEHIGEVESELNLEDAEGHGFTVRMVSPTPTRRAWTLITTGLSDESMDVPDPKIPPFCELVLSLPGDWRFTEEALASDRWGWPIEMLRQVAAVPRIGWLGMDAIVPNGDPPEPYAEGVGFAGALVFPSMTLPKEAALLELDNRDRIAFYAVYPVFTEEMELVQEAGAEVLTDRFDAERIGDVLKLGRTNVAIKRWGL